MITEVLFCLAILGHREGKHLTLAYDDRYSEPSIATPPLPTVAKVSEENKIMGVVTEGNLMAYLLNGRVQPEDLVTNVMYKQFKKVGGIRSSVFFLSRPMKTFEATRELTTFNCLSVVVIGTYTVVPYHERCALSPTCCCPRSFGVSICAWSWTSLGAKPSFPPRNVRDARVNLRQGQWAKNFSEGHVH